MDGRTPSVYHRTIYFTYIGTPYWACKRHTAVPNVPFTITKLSLTYSFLRWYIGVIIYFIYHLRRLTWALVIYYKCIFQRKCSILLSQKHWHNVSFFIVKWNVNHSLQSIRSKWNNLIIHYCRKLLQVLSRSM